MRVATNIHLDHSYPLERNGPHYAQSLHEVGKSLLNLVPGETLSLVKELAYLEVGVACGGVQRGTPSANVTKMCRPPGTCVALDVDHGAACTWH